MTKRIRASEIAIFCAFVLFSTAWLAVQQVRDPLPDWLRVVNGHPEIRAAFVAAQIAGLVAVLAVAVGGLPIICIVIKQAIEARETRVIRLLLAPVAALVVLVVYAMLARGSWTERQRPAANAPLTPLAVVLQLGLVLLVALAIGASIAAVAVTVTRSEPDERIVRFALIPAAVATAAMGATLAAVIVLGLLIQRAAPDLFPIGWLAVVVLLMATATGVAALALRRGLSARLTA